MDSPLYMTCRFRRILQILVLFLNHLSLDLLLIRLTYNKAYQGEADLPICSAASSSRLVPAILTSVPLDLAYDYELSASKNSNIRLICLLNQRTPIKSIFLCRYYTRGDTNFDVMMDGFFSILYNKMFTVLNSQYEFDEK